MSRDRTGVKKASPGQQALQVVIPTGLPSDYKADERILSPIPGVVTRVFVQAGDRVAPGDPLLLIEAMKMKNTLRSKYDLKVDRVPIKAGEVVKAGQLLVGFVKPG